MLRLGRTAVAGAAMMTLMACYGGPIEWELEEDLVASSVLLDAGNPSLQRMAEFTVNQAALGEAVGHTLRNHVRVTPVDADTEVVVSITVEGGAPLETTVLAGDPVSVTLCDTTGDVYSYGECTSTLDQGFSGCSDETCTKATSIAVTLVGGQAIVEQTVSLIVQGPDTTEPEGALASVRWLP